MLFKKQTILSYPAVFPFEMQLNYVEVDRNEPASVYQQHAHAECEICINLTGDVSFAVENRIYPVLPGDIVITKPYEYHHCIYHSDQLHKHFCILLSANGNESLLKLFFARRNGEQNLLRLSEEQGRELVALCHSMLEPPESELEQSYRFFQFLHLLECAKSPTPNAKTPEDVSQALEYLHHHLHQPISVQELAAQAHVSVSTLERHFEAALQLSPSAYIKKKRLSNAAELLYRGASVTEACVESGFSDYSNFIALFKKYYGVTPLQYRKKMR